MTDYINTTTSEYPEDNTFNCSLLAHVTSFAMHQSSITGEENRQSCPTANQNGILQLNLAIPMKKVDPDPFFVRFVGILICLLGSLNWDEALI